jgi:uncharacterized protein YecE (DUF72 family)
VADDEVFYQNCSGLKGVRRQAINQSAPLWVKGEYGRKASVMAQIRSGIGGWDFPGWRKNFYPVGLAQAKELDYASRHVTTIEINGTFYRTQKPESFRRWAEAVPENFLFSVKAHRLTTHRKDLTEAEPSIAQFLTSGVLELGARLGPLLWQFAPTKKFVSDDFEHFLAALPREAEGHRLRHVVEVRHASFCDPAFVALTQKYETAICLAESDKYPLIADVTADFVYLRLQKTRSEIATGYSADELDRWTERAKLWSSGEVPPDLPYLAEGQKPRKQPRDCFVYFIAGAKERNPAAAQALMARLAEK